VSLGQDIDLTGAGALLGYQYDGIGEGYELS